MFARTNACSEYEYMVYRVFLDCRVQMIERIQLSKKSPVNMDRELNSFRDKNRLGRLGSFVRKNVRKSNREHRIISKNISDTNRCVKLKQKSQGMKYYVSRREVFDRDLTSKHSAKIILHFSSRSP